MTTIKMKSDEVIGYCEKAIAYWMAETDREIELCPDDAWIKYRISCRGVNYKEISTAQRLIALAELSNDEAIYVSEEIIEIIDISKKEFMPRTPMAYEEDPVLSALK